jgi:hypothetical protein
MVGGLDFIHANAAGHMAMGEVFKASADEMYGNCE